MKVLKGLGYFVLITLGALLLAALFAPSEKQVVRSIEIDATREVIFEQVANFENWKKWDAWYRKDTNQVRTYIGKVGSQNQRYSWSSENKGVGKGKMKMDKISGKERLDYTFYFDGNPKSGYFLLDEKGNRTSVKWVMISKQSYPFTLFNYAIEKMVAPDFEAGLANLKIVAEKENKQLLLRQLEQANEMQEVL
ncbi:MAG: SRPBCC family protein [Bacteroidetes bacterium]|jgi:hypothetical protein|nr:SRPBCC family protein [Bacteroidota bacterium]